MKQCLHVRSGTAGAAYLQPSKVSAGAGVPPEKPVQVAEDAIAPPLLLFRIILPLCLRLSRLRTVSPYLAVCGPELLLTGCGWAGCDKACACDVPTVYCVATFPLIMESYGAVTAGPRNTPVMLAPPPQGESPRDGQPAALWPLPVAQNVPHVMLAGYTYPPYHNMLQSVEQHKHILYGVMPSGRHWGTSSIRTSEATCEGRSRGSRLCLVTKSKVSGCCRRSRMASARSKRPCSWYRCAAACSSALLSPPGLRALRGLPL